MTNVCQDESFIVSNPSGTSQQTPQIPRVGSMALVRNRHGIIAAVSPYQSKDGPVLHLVDEGEGVGTDGDGFAGAEAGHTDADAGHGIVLECAVGAGDGDRAAVALEEGLELLRVFEVEGLLGDSAEGFPVGLVKDAVKFVDDGGKEKRPFSAWV